MPKTQTYTVRFSAEEYERLKSLAAQEDAKLGDLIRNALASYGGSKDDSATIEIDSPSDSKVYVYRGVPASSRTIGTASPVQQGSVSTA